MCKNTEITAFLLSFLSFFMRSFTAFIPLKAIFSLRPLFLVLTLHHVEEAKSVKLYTLLLLILIMDERSDFIDALLHYATAQLLHQDRTADYCRGAIKILDARNHLFTFVFVDNTDEENAIYALRDLCRVDPDTLDTMVDRGKIASLARTYFD